MGRPTDRVRTLERYSSAAHEALKPLGLHPSQIKLVLSDTAKAPNSGGAAASRSQVMVGNAIVDRLQKAS